MARFIQLLLPLLLLLACQGAQANSLELTPQQQTLWDKLATTTDPSHELLVKVINQLPDEALDLLSHFTPDGKLTPEFLDRVYEIAYNSDLSVKQRGMKLKQLAGINSPDEYVERRVCIWDPVGRAGPIFQAALDQKTKAMSFGINLQLVPYTDESIITVDLKAGRCDAALISGLRARMLVKFTGTTDAVGAITTDKQMRTLLYVLSRPKMAKNMVQGPFVTLGIAQGGAAYVFVNDRSINSLAKAAGKKVAVLGYDPVQAEMVADLGATPVRCTLLTAPSKFNNGVVDVLAAPLVAYQAMELYKGMTPNGGIIDYPLAQITMQLIGWRSRIPNVIGQLIRESFYANYDKINAALNNEVKDIPERWWIQIPQKDKREYEKLMQQARIKLRDQGYYSGDMLTLQRKIRCKFHPEHSECSNPVE